MLTKDSVVVEGLELDQLDSVVGVWVETDNRLQSIRIDSDNLTYNSNFDVLGVILRDCHIRGRVVLLVTHQDVRDKGTLAREERDSEFDSFAVPVLRVFPLEGYSSDRFIKLVQESEFGAHTEV